MDYKEIYKRFIHKYKSQIVDSNIYYEKHHIIPKAHLGTDELSNVILLTYKQHTFAHRLLWKAYGKPTDLMAYMLMSGTEVDVRRARQSANGVANVRSGLLERIRLLANTKVRQEKLAEMNKLKWECGDGLKAIQAANIAWRGSNHTEDFKRVKSESYKKRFDSDEWKK